MRVSANVRTYVHAAFAAKVAEAAKAADAALAAAEKARDAKVEKAKELAAEIAKKANAEFAKKAAKLGLTFLAETADWRGPVPNKVIDANVGHGDFEETLDPGSADARLHPNGERAAFAQLKERPGKIRAAATLAADRLLFELELGKVAKKELDDLLKAATVEIPG